MSQQIRSKSDLNPQGQSQPDCWHSSFSREWRFSFVAFFLLIFVIYSGSPNFRFQDSPHADPYGGDLIQEWVAGYVIWSGQGDRLYDQEFIKTVQHTPEILGFQWNTDGYFPTPYPPFYYLLTSPLAWFPLTISLWIWAAFMMFCLLFSLLLWSDYGWDEKQRLIWLLPATVLFLPVTESLLSSQKGTVLLVIVMGMFALLRTERDFTAGILTGLLMFKPHLLLLPVLLMVGKQRWRFIMGLSVTGLILALTSVCLLGPETCLNWLQLISGFGDYLATPGYETWKTHCWWGAFHQLFSQEHEVFVKFMTLLAIMGTLFVVRTGFAGDWQPKEPRFVWQFSLMVTAMILCSPHLYTYDCSLLLVPMLALLTDPTVSRKRNVGMLCAVMLFAFFGQAIELTRLTGLPITVLMLAGLMYQLKQESLAAKPDTDLTEIQHLQLVAAPTRA